MDKHADMPQVRVVSFGYGHADQPEADLTIDARRLYRNPHHDPRMRELTGLDAAVREHVLATPGVREVLGWHARIVLGLVDQDVTPVTVAVGCVGGRHRSVAMADALAAELHAQYIAVDVDHRDVDKQVIQKTK